MGIFKSIERYHIENELKEQRLIFNSQIKDEIEQSRKKPTSPQETEAEFHKQEIQFRQWFIENYIIPKYFLKSVPPWF